MAIALANKMARRIWAMLTKGDSYRDPALPKIAFAPLIIVWFGIGIESKIAIAAALTFIVSLIATYNGTLETDRDLLRLRAVDQRALLHLDSQLAFLGRVNRQRCAGLDIRRRVTRAAGKPITTK